MSYGCLWGRLLTIVSLSIHESSTVLLRQSWHKCKSITKEGLHVFQWCRKMTRASYVSKCLWLDMVRYIKIISFIVFGNSLFRIYMYSAKKEYHEIGTCANGSYSSTYHLWYIWVQSRWVDYWTWFFFLVDDNTLLFFPLFFVTYDYVFFYSL